MLQHKTTLKEEKGCPAINYISRNKGRSDELSKNL